LRCTKMFPWRRCILIIASASRPVGSTPARV
jgi:hypothetical protein